MKQPVSKPPGAPKPRLELEAIETEEIFHIRKRLRPRKGSQWYKDKNLRQVETFCGAAVTEHDINWNAEPIDWTKTHRIQQIVYSEIVYADDIVNLVYCRTCYNLSRKDSLQHYAEAKKTSKNKVKLMQKKKAATATKAVTQKAAVKCGACAEDAQIHESIIHSGKLYHRRCLEANPNLPTSATMPLLPPLTDLDADTIIAEAQTQTQAQNAKQVKIEFPVDTLLQITKLLPKTQTQDRIKIASALAKHGEVLGQCKQCKGAFLAEEMIRVENCQSNASIRALMLLLEPKTPAQARKRRFNKNAKNTPVPVFLFCSTDCDKMFDEKIRESIKTIREAMAAVPMVNLDATGKPVRRGSWRNAPSRKADDAAVADAISATRQQQQQQYTKRTVTTRTSTTTTVVEEQAEASQTEIVQVPEITAPTWASETNISPKIRKMYEKNLEFEIEHKTYRVHNVQAALARLEPRAAVKIKIRHPNSGLTYQTFGRWQHDEGYGSLDEIVMFIIGSTGNFLSTKKVG